MWFRDCVWKNWRPGIHLAKWRCLNLSLLFRLLLQSVERNGHSQVSKPSHFETDIWNKLHRLGPKSDHFLSVHYIEHKGTSWDTGISKVHDMNPAWNGSESRPCRFPSFKIGRKKQEGKQAMQIDRKHNWICFVLLCMSWLGLGGLFFVYVVCLFIFFLKCIKSPIFRKLKF